MRLLIAGHGAMAQELRNVCAANKVNPIRCLDFPGTYPMSKGVIAVHLGSGREFSKLLQHCIPNSIPILQCSSGISVEPCDTVCVSALNTARPAVLFVEEIRQAAEKFREDALYWEIVESHQSTKVGVSATARMIADIVGMDPERIVSVREPVRQRELNVPEKYLAVHAYHWVKATTRTYTREWSCKINGRRIYAEGIVAIAQKLQNKRFELQPQKIYDAKYFL